MYTNGDDDYLPANWEFRHMIIADYKHSTIMEQQEERGDCEITRFDQSLNIISNLLSETWIPRVDSFTTYLGV